MQLAPKSAIHIAGISDELKYDNERPFDKGRERTQRRMHGLHVLRQAKYWIIGYVYWGRLRSCFYSDWTAIKFIFSFHRQRKERLQKWSSKGGIEYNLNLVTVLDMTYRQPVGCNVLFFVLKKSQLTSHALKSEFEPMTKWTTFNSKRLFSFEARRI